MQTSDGVIIDLHGQPEPLAPLPSSAGVEALATTDGLHLVAAAVPRQDAVAEYISEDGGLTWSSSGEVTIPTPTGMGDLWMGLAGGRVTVLANEPSGSNASLGRLATASVGGGSWRVVDAPTGGILSAAGGSFWITGGVMGDRIFTSADGSTWQRRLLPESSPYWSAAPPLAVSGVGTVVPVTSHDPVGASRVTLWATTDGGSTWTALESFAAPHSEFATTIPLSISTDGNVFAVWPDGSKVLTGVVGSGALRTISPNGLPSNVYQVVALSDREAFAAASPDSCPNGKQSCRSATVIVRTTDGGQTWQPAT